MAIDLTKVNLSDNPRLNEKIDLTNLSMLLGSGANDYARYGIAQQLVQIQDILREEEHKLSESRKKTEVLERNVEHFNTMFDALAGVFSGLGV